MQAANSIVADRKITRPLNRFFDRDHTLVANFLHRIGEKLADLNIAICGNRTGLGDLGAANRHFGPGSDIGIAQEFADEVETPSLAATSSIVASAPKVCKTIRDDGTVGTPRQRAHAIAQRWTKSALSP